jgi:hypothetical protein
MIFVTVQTKLEVPTIPNFVRTQIGESIPIRDLTDDQLKAIGEEWAKQLVEKARRAPEADRKLPGDYGIKVPA